jgi:hypothetical protein
MMAIFMDRRGRLAKLHKSRKLTLNEITEWDLGTIIVSTEPYDVAVPLCVGYVVSGDTYCVARITSVVHDKMVGYRLKMLLEGDSREIHLVAQTRTSYNLIQAQLLLQNPVEIGVDAFRLFTETPLSKDPQFNLGINAGVRLFGEQFDAILARAYKRQIIPMVNNEMYQELMRLERRHVLDDAHSTGLITGYYTAIWNLQLMGEGMIANPLLSRAASIRALAGLSDNFDYQVAQLTGTT